MYSIYSYLCHLLFQTPQGACKDTTIFYYTYRGSLNDKEKIIYLTSSIFGTTSPRFKIIFRDVELILRDFEMFDFFKVKLIVSL